MLDLILDILYPPKCVSCGAAGSWWCEACRSSVERPDEDPCPRCLKDHRRPEFRVCKGDLPFAGIVVTGFYHSAPLRTYIGALKYQGVTASSRDMAAYLRSYAETRHGVFPWSEENRVTIIPMPLGETRKRERGFNQALWIAERLKEAILPRAEIAQVLARADTAMPQAKIEDAELRKANVRGGFVATKPVSGAVVIVDDVITTGATAREVARTLKEVGATRVYVFALALGR